MKTTRYYAMALALCFALSLTWFAMADRGQASYKGPKGAAAGDATLKVMYHTIPVVFRCGWPCDAYTNLPGVQSNVYRLTSMTVDTWPVVNTNGQYISFIIFTNSPTRVTPGDLTAEALTFVGNITTSAAGTAGNSGVATYTFKTVTNYTFSAHTEPVSNVWFNPVPGCTSSWIMIK